MEARVQALVIGAGPVGLMTALQLKKHGVHVKIADEGEQRSARSFAVVLHPRTVAMLANLGIVEPLSWQGHSFKRVAVFAGGQRQALLTLPVDGELADGGLTLPQNVLRTALEVALSSEGVEVDYGQRFVSVEQGADEVHTWLETAPLEATAQGGLARAHVASQFVIGADGFGSAVREALGIRMLPASEERSFAFFDVARSAPVGTVTELALAERLGAMYPLHGERTRYSFELESAPARQLGASGLAELLRARMPWHPATAEGVEWSGVRSFQPALAERFGRGRVWLVGDACHVTNPIGAQSLNIGLREARDLALAVVDCVAGRELEHLASGYAEQRQLEWRRLLALGNQPRFGARTPAWAVEHFSRLLASLPASGDDLDDLLAQLGIDVL